MGLYKDTLMNQMRMNDQNRKNFGKMTFVEKKLNRNDLQRYKKKEADTVTALIPGINNINGVGGSQPLQRGAMKMLGNDQYVGVGKNRGEIHFQSPQRSQTKGEYYQLGPVYNNPIPTQSAVKGRTEMRYAPPQQQRAMTPRNNSSNQLNQSDFDMRRSMPGDIAMARSRAVQYNPITNPVDASVHNP